MSKVIDSFLVALGIEVDEESAKDTKKSIDEVRTNAIAMGGALAAAFAGADIAAKKTAGSLSQISRSAKLLTDVGVQDLDKWQHAFSMEGVAEDADATFRQLQSTLGNLNVLGELGPFGDLAKLGLNPDFLMDAKTSVELFEKLAQIYPKLSSEQQMLADEALGINDTAARMLRSGPERINEYLERAEQLGVVNQQMTENALKLEQAGKNFSRAFQSILNAFTGAAAGDMANTIDRWADTIASFVDVAEKVGGFFGDSYEPLAAGAAVAGGGAALGTASAVTGKVGMTKTSSLLKAGGSVLARAGLVGTAGYLGYKAGEWLELDEKLNKYIKKKTGYESLGDFTFSVVNQEDPLLRNTAQDKILNRYTSFNDQMKVTNNTTNKPSVVHNNQQYKVEVNESKNPGAVKKIVEQVIQGQVQNGIQQSQSGIKG